MSPCPPDPFILITFELNRSRLQLQALQADYRLAQLELEIATQSLHLAIIRHQQAHLQFALHRFHPDEPSSATSSPSPRL